MMSAGLNDVRNLVPLNTFIIRSIQFRQSMKCLQISYSTAQYQYLSQHELTDENDIMINFEKDYESTQDLLLIQNDQEEEQPSFSTYRQYLDHIVDQMMVKVSNKSIRDLIRLVCHVILGFLVQWNYHNHRKSACKDIKMLRNYIVLVVLALLSFASYFYVQLMGICMFLLYKKTFLQQIQNTQVQLHDKLMASLKRTLLQIKISLLRTSELDKQYEKYKIAQYALVLQQIQKTYGIYVQEKTYFIDYLDEFSHILFIILQQSKEKVQFLKAKNIFEKWFRFVKLKLQNSHLNNSLKILQKMCQFKQTNKKSLTLTIQMKKQFFFKKLIESIQKIKQNQCDFLALEVLVKEIQLKTLLFNKKNVENLIFTKHQDSRQNSQIIQNSQINNSEKHKQKTNRVYYNGQVVDYEMIISQQFKNQLQILILKQQKQIDDSQITQQKSKSSNNHQSSSGRQSQLERYSFGFNFKIPQKQLSNYYLE